MFTIDFDIAKEKNDPEPEEDEENESDIVSLSKHAEENEDSIDLEGKWKKINLAFSLSQCSILHTFCSSLR